MSQYDDGFRAGIEAAAKVVERRGGTAYVTEAGPATLAKAIRSLSHPPQPATMAEYDTGKHEESVKYQRAFSEGYDHALDDVRSGKVKLVSPPQPATLTCLACGTPYQGVARCANPDCPKNAPPGDDAGRCSVCDGVGLVAYTGPAGVPHTISCKSCHGTGRAGGGGTIGGTHGPSATDQARSAAAAVCRGGVRASDLDLRPVAQPSREARQLDGGTGRAGGGR